VLNGEPTIGTATTVGGHAEGYITCAERASIESDHWCIGFWTTAGLVMCSTEILALVERDGSLQAQGIQSALSRQGMIVITFGRMKARMVCPSENCGETRWTGL
jgi:hypothetical protein